MNSRYLARSGVVLSLLLGPSLRLAAADWLPIDPADLAATHSTIDPDAGAEILYREKTVDDSYDHGSMFSEYFRIKIYNDTGVAALDKIEISSASGSRVTNLIARVVKPDGTIVNLDKKAFFTRDALRAGKERVRVKSFSFPGLEPGVIVEYRWDTSTDESVGGLYLPLQGEMPTRHLRLRVKPYSYPGLFMNTIFHRCESRPLKQGKDDFFLIEMRDLPAVKAERYRPPEMEYQSWVLFYFTLEKETPESYWQRVGKADLEPLEKKARPRKEVQAAVAAIVAGAADDGEKLTRIHDYCRSKIRNTALDASGFTPDQIAALKKNESAADTLQRGHGSPTDINALFVALARAAGFDAHFVKCSDRDETFFDPKIMWQYALSDLVTGVKLGEEWRFFDPAATYVEAGSLHWENEGVQALALDTKKCVWVKTPLTPAARSRTIRNARLSLSEDGTLEGDVTFQFRGHDAVSVKQDLGPRAPEDYEDLMRGRLQSRLNGAEVSKVEILNAADPLAPVSMAYHIRVPGYAQRTGQRLFFQPGYFQKGRDAKFTTTTREYDLYFSFPWSEEDVVNISLPAGFSLEEANSPQSLPNDSPINYTCKLGTTRTGDRIRLTRTFESRPIFVGKSAYPVLKDMFDLIHTSDEHTLILKRNAPVAPAPEAAPAP